MRNSAPYFKYVLLASATLLSSEPAFAQAAEEQGDSTGLGEIIVTARKQSESALNVPVAVAAIGAEEIQSKGVVDIASIVQLTPQVSVSNGEAGNGSVLTIRGLGTSFIDSGLEQSVLVVLDGAPVTRGQVVRMGMFDLAQVEVLKGPQSLFFGKNSPAGVISFTSAGAKDQLEGYVRVGYEFEARQKYVDAAITGPISETLSGRLAIRASDMRGWIRNTAQPLTAPVVPTPDGPLTLSPPFFPVSTPSKHKYGPGDRDLMARGTLTWKPSSDFDATLKVAVGDHRDNGTTAQQWCDPALNPGLVTLVPGIVDTTGNCEVDNQYVRAAYPVAFITPDMVNMRSDGEPYWKVRTWLTNLNMDYRTEKLTFTSVTSYLDLNQSNAADVDQSSYGAIFQFNGERSKIFTQEMRVASDYDGPLNFKVGGYYESVRRTNIASAVFGFFGPVPSGFPGTGRADSWSARTQAKSSTLSAFGQMRWKVLDNLELTGGVRYTKETRDQTMDNLFVHPVFGGYVDALGNFVPGVITNLIPAGFQVKNLKFRDSNWSPEVTLSYKPTSDTMIYAAFKTGYKSGGFSAGGGLLSLNPAGPGCTSVTCRLPDGSRFGFGPEQAKGFEAGFKGKFANNRARIELTAYTYEYSNLQQANFDAPTFTVLIKNAAAARIKGVELAGEWMPVDGLRLSTALSYNDARFTSFPNARCYSFQTPAQGCDLNPTTGAFEQDLTGKRLPRAPAWNLLAGINYDVPVSSGWNLGFSGDVNYSSGFSTQETQPPFAYQREFALWNAGVRLHSADDHYEIAFIGRNLGNKYYVSGSVQSPIAVGQDNLQAPTPRGRELNIQATYRF